MPRLRFLGANPEAQVVGREQLPGKVNYLIGNQAQHWHTNIPTYAKVAYQGIYPGVDVVFYGNQRRLEYDLVLASGADPQAIQLAFEGVEKLEVDARGDLLLHTGGGILYQRRPVVYQDIAGVRRPIAADYQLTGANRVGFRLAAFDPGKRLVIDPLIDYSSYLGGEKKDEGFGIAADGAGNAYVTGSTDSLQFPQAGAWQSFRAGKKDAFVAKLSPSGSTLLYATYLGGDKDDEGFGITVGGSGVVYLTGYTESDDFPTAAAWQMSHAGQKDAFVASLSAEGDALRYATYLGGKKKEEGRAIALDSLGYVVVTGFTDSSDFPLLAPWQAEQAGNDDAFVVRLDTEGIAVFATYLGGKHEDRAHGVAIDSLDRIIIAGATKSKDDFPLANPWQAVYGGGGTDAFVARLAADGAALNYATYLGGKHEDEAYGVAVDKHNRIIVAGATKSKDDFPLVNALQPVYGGGSADAFVARLAADGATLDYATYLGGKHEDAAYGVAVDSGNAVHLTGVTKSKDDFPTVAPVQPGFGGEEDAFVAKLGPDGSELIHASYLGGDKKEEGRAVAVSGSDVYLVGHTSSENDFPLENPLQAVSGGKTDAFVTKIHYVPPTLEFLNPLDGDTLEDSGTNFEVTFAAGEVELDLDSFQLIINGVDVTLVTEVTENGASYMTASPEGLNTATASISDRAGLSASATIGFTVEAAEVFRAIADCAPRSGPVPLTVRFRSRGEFSGGSIVRYRWDFDGDGSFNTSDSVARDYNFTFQSKGTFNPVLEVTNNLGETATDTCAIEVRGNAPTAIANASPSNGPIPLDVSFACTGSDSDGSIVRYEWDFEGDGVYDFSSPSAGNASHTYTQEGLFVAVCRVTDNDGLTGEARTTTTVIRPAPPGSPSVTATVSPASGNAPLTVFFGGSAVDDGTIVQWEWDFEGDGTFDYSSTSPVTSFTYTNAGIFAAALRATDDNGQTGIDTVEVVANINASLSIPDDTFDPTLGETASVNTALTAGVPVRVLLKDQDGAVIRTLVNEFRAAGNYSDPWDGRDAAGQLLPQAPYYAVLEYDFGGEVRSVDLTNTTGGARYNPSRTGIPSTFSPLAGQPLTINFTIPTNRGASEVTAFIGRFNVDTRLVTFMERVPFGVGTYSITWNGENADGQLFHPPSGDRFLFGIFGYTLPDNAIFVRSGAHISGFAVTPSIFDPTGHVDDQGTPERSALTFNLSNPADVELTVDDAETGERVARLSYSGLAAGASTIYWDGRNENGVLVAPGRYRLGVAAIDSTGYRSIRIYLLQRVYY